MAGMRGKDGDCPLSQPFSAAGLPSWLDPDGNHGQMWVMILKPAKEGVALPSNPFTIAKSIQATVGTIAEAYRDREQNLVLKVRGETKAKKLKQMTKLIDGTKVTVTEHPRLNLTKVVVTCHSVSGMSDEELKAEPALQEQGVVDVRRFRKGGPTMTLTIQGTVAPEAIFFGYDRCRTKLFTQAPLQCFRCFEFGHPKIRCQANEVCRNCSEVHSIIKDDEGKTICEKPARCRNCNGPHSPTTRACPVFKQEEEIEKIRSTGKSAREARRLYEEERKKNKDSYAGVVSTSVQNRLETAQKANGDHCRKELIIAQKEEETRKELEKQLASYQRKLQRAMDKISKLKAKKEQNMKEKEKETKAKETRGLTTASNTQKNKHQNEDDMETEEKEDDDEEEDDEDDEDEDEEEDEEEDEDEDEDEENEDSRPEPIKRHRSDSSEESSGSTGARKVGKNLPNTNNKTLIITNDKTTDKNKSPDWQKVPVNKNKQNKRSKH